MRRELLLAAGLIAITLAAYWRVGNLPFLAYDDNTYVYENARVRQGLNPSNAAWAFTATRAANWHPITWLSLLLDARLFGMRSNAFHVENLAWHTLNVLLLFYLLRQMTGAVWRSAMAAALLGVHPVHVESVAWVAERKDLLSGFFALLAMMAYVRYVRRPSLGRFAIVAMLFVLGLMAKPMLVTLPLVLLLLDYWPLGRIAREQDQGLITRQTWHVVLEKLPLLAISALACVITYSVQQRSGAMYLMDYVPLTTRLANAILAYAAYLGNTFWPLNLSVIYPLWTHVSAVTTAAAAAMLLAISWAAAWGARNGRRYLAVGWLWYLGMLVPVIGLVQVGAQSMADRYTYLPLIGIFVAIVWGASDLLARWPAALAWGAAAVLAACGMLTAWQTQYWSSTQKLFTRSVQITAGSPVAETYLANMLLAEGHTHDAVTHYRMALRASPDYVFARTNLAVALLAEKQYDEAVEECRLALRARRDYTAARNNLAAALFAKGDVDAALAECREALRYHPHSVEVHANIARIFAYLGRTDEAIAAWQAVLHGEPDDAVAARQLAALLARKGQASEAIGILRRSLAVNADDTAAQRQLAELLRRKQR
jgi:protein O-mannosyl-transferase